MIPKQQVEFLWDLDDEIYQRVMATSKKVANRIKDVIKPSFVGMQVIGVDVAHAHVHLIPFSSVQEFRKVPNMTEEPDHNSLKETARILAF